MLLLQKLEALNQRFGVWLFYAGLVFFFLSYRWFWQTDASPIIIKGIQHHCLTLGIYFCVIRIVLFLRKYPIYTILSLLLIASFHWLSHHVTHNYIIFWTLTLILAARDSDVKIALKIYIAILTTILVTNSILYWAGWSADIKERTQFLNGHSWGLSNPNLLGIMLLTITFAALALWQPKKGRRIWAICIATAVIVELMTLCRTAAFAILAFPIIYFLLKRFSIKPIYWTITPIICLVISVGLAFYYGPSLGETTFESRFSIPHLFYLERGIEWFGQDTSFVTHNTSLTEGISFLCLDNAYLRIPLEYGIIPGTLVYVLLCYNIYRIAKHQSLFLFAMALCFLLIGFTENSSIKTIFNFTLLMSFLPFNAIGGNRELLPDNAPRDA